MRKLPFRAGNEISQTYNDGVLTVYGVTDAAKPGYAPKPKPVKKVDLRYEEQRLGLNRYYAALQNNVDVERVVRVPKWAPISPQDIVGIWGGRQYEIRMVQTVPGVWPPSLDLTLARLDYHYDVSKSDTGEARE